MSEEPRKLTAGEQHVLKLVRKEADSEGWAHVSKIVAQLFVSHHGFSPIPKQLCEFQFVGDEGRGIARLTLAGNALLDSLAWL